MITIRREDFTREEWDAAETAIDARAKYDSGACPLAPDLYPWWVIEDWLWYIRQAEHREAGDEEYNPRKVVALMGAACTLERLLEEELITRKTVKPEGAGERIEKGKEQTHNAA